MQELMDFQTIMFTNAKITKIIILDFYLEYVFQMFKYDRFETT